MALGDIQKQFLHRKHGKLYYDIKLLDFDEDLIVDGDGVPDETQNPDAVFIGATDAGYDFTAEPTIFEEFVDEEEAAIDAGVDAIAAQIAFDALEVLDLERLAALQPGATYSENTVGDVTAKRVTGGGSRVSLPSKPVVVISKEKGGGFIGAMLYSGYNAGSHQLQFKKLERAKQSMVIKGLSVSDREDGDRIYRIFSLPAVLTISTATPLTEGDEDEVYAGVTLAVSGGQAPYTWTVTTGTLPTGLTLSSAGVISGTPTVAGSSTFTVEAEDANGAIKTKEFTLVVNAAP
jgi:hypothetical protein